MEGQPAASDAKNVSAPQSAWEKMISGQLYSSSDPDLLALRARAKLLTREYNTTVGYNTDIRVRQKHLEMLFGSVGEKCRVEPPIQVDYGENIHMGDNFYCNFNVVMLDR